MPSPSSILRVLLALTIGFVPMLCCCGTAAANEVAPAQVEQSHDCCAAASEGNTPTAPKPEQAPDHECGCGSHMGAMQNGRGEAMVLPATVELPCFSLAPLPWPLDVIWTDSTADTAGARTSESAAIPAAPTLRTLSVLLLT
jgi:hypothetical protein